MQNRKHLGALGLTLGILLVAGCANTEENISNAPEAKETTVEINTFAFTPKDLEVEVGETIRWVNGDSILHTVTLGTRGEDEQGQPIDVQKDGRLDLQLPEKGSEGSYTFTEAGTYTYFCDRHPGMDATVTVS